MARRNCDSYVSRAIWHGEVGCTGKRELDDESKRGTSSGTVYAFKGQRRYVVERDGK